MNVLAIDPGPTESAFVIWDGKKVLEKAKMLNAQIITVLWISDAAPVDAPDACVIEMVESYGMPVGREVFQTVFWIGRFFQAWSENDRRTEVMPRKDVKMHVCGSMRAKNSNIRQALIDRFGPPGTKKAPGLTYGLSKDLWQAFALAVTFYDQEMEEKYRS